MPNSINSATFWQFSLKFYSDSKVAETLLHWQNHHHKNVNVCLLLLYLNQQHFELSSSHLTELINTLEPFNLTFTQPLRTLRIQLKQHSDLPHYQAMRTQLLATELQFEQQEQQLLIDKLIEFKLGSTSTPDNLSLYINKDLQCAKTDLNQTLLQLQQSTE